MSISARNQLHATVKTIKAGAVNDVIELALGENESLTAVITSESTQRLGLTTGKEVIAVFKAPSVILSTDSELVFSARNQLSATVSEIKHGVVNAEIVVKTQSGREIVAMITEESAQKLQLSIGCSVNVLIKASHILIGVKKS